MAFSVQRALTEMMRQQHENHAALTKRVDDGFDRLTDKLSEHAVRLAGLETAEKRRRWLGRTAAAGLVTFICDLVVNHIPKWWPK